jgi:large subunit ribosomal protein L35
LNDFACQTEKKEYYLCTMTRKGGINKTRKAVAKRFKVTGTGKVLRRKQGKRHILQKKSSKRKRALGRPALVDETQVWAVKQNMPFA